MARIVFIEGEKIDLVVLDKDRHFNNFVKWLNDSLVTRWLTHGVYPLMKEAEEKWWSDLDSNKNVILAIETKDNLHIGSIGLHKIDYISGHGEMGIFIGEPKLWGKGLATEAEMLIIKYGFSELNLRIIYGRIFSKNIGSIKAAEKNKFKEEGRLKRHVYKNGRFNDILIFALHK